MSLDDLVDEAERNGGDASCILHHTYFDGRHPSETQAGPIVETTAYPPKKTLNYLPRSMGSWAPEPAPRQMFRRSQFEHVIKMWSFPKHHTIKGGIVLTAGDSFSPAFGRMLGLANTINIYGLDDRLIREAVFEALAEREATIQFRSGGNDHLTALVNIDEGYHGIVVFGRLGPDGKLRWRINHGKENEGRWVDLLQQVFNLPRMDALATLAKIVNMDIERLQILSSDRHSIELNGSLRSDEDVPEVLHLSRLPAGSGCAELVGKAYIYGNAGQVIGAILSYQLDGKDFCLPATVGKKTLCMGKYKPTAHFLNQHLMDQHPGATILFCQDMRTALAVQMFFNQARENNPDAEIIVTAHLGDDLSVLPWNYIYGHEVIFVPAPSKQCMAMLNLYAAQIKGAGARDFRIYPGFLLHSLPVCGLKDHVEGVTEAEAKLLHSAVVLEEVERPIHQARKMIDESISYRDYKNWGERLGIFKSPIKTNTLTSEAQILALPPADPALTPAPAHDLAHVTLYHVMRIGNYVVMLGAKGAGKTQVSLSCCHSIIKGYSMWPFFRGTGITAGNVVYIDAETPYDEYCANLEQHGLAGEAGHRFFGISKFAPGLPEFCETFSLTDAKFREGLLHYLLNHQCRYIFLDNLTALMGDAVHQGKAAQEVLDWVENLQKHGLCVVLVHHKSEYETIAPQKDKARGSQLFIIRARTVIGLVNKEEILDECLGTAAVQESALQDGLTIGIRYQVSKPAPILERKTFWLYLPLGASEWKFLAATGADGKEIMLSMEEMADGAKLVSEREGSPVVSSNAHFQPTTEHDLSPDERRVVEALRKEPSKRHKVQEQTGFAEDKALALLHSLINRNLVVKKGEGKATYYSLKPNV